MPDDEQQPPDSVRRVGPKDRKERLDYGKRLFPPETPLPLDPPAPDAEAEPLPFDETWFAEAEDAAPHPPLPFDGEEPVASAQTEERFPPLPPPGWARPAPETQPQPVRPMRSRPKRRPAPPPPPKRGRGCFYNLLALLFLALTAGAIWLGVTIYNNPYSLLNPLPPPTPLPIVITATFGPPAEPTPAPILGPLPGEATAEATDAPVMEPTATFTPLPADLLTQLAPPTQQGSLGP